ncbi:ankyrin repeat-containing domain protein [Nemania diffusa]|nr:ankyrin repeat-containing domain protein [Nemania diffusa]
MDLLDEPMLFGSAEQQETERLRERNRVAKRASRARQKQRENNESVPSNPPNTRRQSLVLPTTTDELISPPFQAPESASGQVPENSESRAVINSTSDENWTLGVNTSTISDPATVLWDNSLGPAIESSDSVQHLTMSSSLAGHLSGSTPPPHPAPSLPFHSLDRVSISTHYDSPAELIYPGSDIVNHSSSLLHIAIRNGTKGIVSSLIKFGIDVDSVDSSGSSPLHVAVELRQLGVLELLLNSGANINARNSAQMTPLEIAVRAQDEQIVNILLSRGAELY